MEHISLLNHHSIQCFKEKEGLLQDGYSQLIFDENKTQIFVETKNVCSHQNYLYEKYNLIGDNKIFAEEFPITCDHQRLTSLLIDSSLVTDPLNKITSFDIRSSLIHSPITSFHDTTLYKRSCSFWEREVLTYWNRRLFLGFYLWKTLPSFLLSSLYYDLKIIISR